MEAGATNEDCHEFDKILEETPDATTGYTCTRESIQGFEPISLFEVRRSSASSYLRDPFSTLQAWKDYDIISSDDNFTMSKAPSDQKDDSHDYHGTLTVNVDQDASSLPDDQSLTSAFQVMSFQDRIASNSSNTFLEHNQSSVSHALSSDGNQTAYLNKCFSGLDSTERVPSPGMLNGDCLPNPESQGYSAFIIKNVPNKQCRIVDGHHDVRSLKPNFHDSRSQVPSVLDGRREQWPSFQGHSAVMPVKADMQTYVLPGVLAEGIKFPASSFQHQYYMDAPSHAYTPNQHLRNSNIAWHGMENERNYRSHPHYLQQPNNHHLEVHMQRRRNSETEPPSGNASQSYYEDEIVGNRRYNQLDPSLLSGDVSRNHLNEFSSQLQSCLIPQAQKLPSSCGLYFPGTDYGGYNVSNRFSKQTFPRKKLTMSHGVNSRQTLKSGSMGNNQFPEHGGNSRREVSFNYVNSGLVRCDEIPYLGVQRSRGSFSNIADDKYDLNSPYLKYCSLDNVIGQIHILAKDQNGCRFLQKIFEEGNYEDIYKIFVEIIDHVVELMTDIFGNYLIQKLIKVCNEEQITKILRKISDRDSELFQISCNQHGTRVIQKIIETIKTPEQYSLIVSTLRPYIVSLIKNNNGSHVAQRCLQHLPDEHKELLFEAVVANGIELARDRHGCCVLQKCISDLNTEQKFRLISNMTHEACDLSQDPYGNYVVQYILIQEIPWATAGILDQLEFHYGTLSVQKYSSNVVEKCLKHAGNDRRVNIVWELISDPYFHHILQDAFGNYVIQSALRACKGLLRATLSEAIRPHEVALRSHPYGKKILSSAYYGK
ncbi:uncharacterized protein LOC103976370 [Musa acuminata AAA Group]|uniref:uncharacterized protein LOC103976370 n=1 Tax=Musa acuminata AAA Group TaxID=214697 RepID=UPI0031CF9B87